VVDGAEAESLPRLELAEGGKLSGYTGCNMMSGTWRQEGGEARFGPIISTKRFCLGAGGEIEKRLMAAFAPGARGVREDGKLVLIAPGGARFEFRPAAAG
jgi:heat shock protein HslJ